MSNETPTIYCETCEQDIPITSIQARVNADVIYSIAQNLHGKFVLVQEDVVEMDNIDYEHDNYDEDGYWTGACSMNSGRSGTSKLRDVLTYDPWNGR